MFMLPFIYVFFIVYSIYIYIYYNILYYLHIYIYHIILYLAQHILPLAIE